MTTTKQLRRWLISVARPVLKPLGASIVFRHVDQLAGLALLAISAGAVTKVAGNALGAPASETAWLPNTAAAEATIDLAPKVAVKRKIDVALSNSFGFGGTNASLIVGKVRA